MNRTEKLKHIRTLLQPDPANILLPEHSAFLTKWGKKDLAPGVITDANRSTKVLLHSPEEIELFHSELNALETPIPKNFYCFIIEIIHPKINQP
jgi:hypothetical protein